LITDSIIGSRLGIPVSPEEVRLIPKPEDPYKWAFIPQKRHLFQKQLSEHCIRAYKEISRGIDDEAFEAIPADTNDSQSRATATIAEVISEKTSNLEVQTKPAASFTAKINELTSHNIRLMTELEHAERLNSELEANLKAAQLDANALQQENERMKEACYRNSLAANFFRAKATQLDAVIKEISSTLESAKAKIPVVSPGP
jgi:chromosome segregation ATPase